MAVHHNYVEVKGVKIHVVSNSANSDTLLVLFHGARFDAETWVRLGTLEALESNNIKALALDFPGFGKSERGEWKDLPYFISDFLELQRIERPILLGPSMGGRAVLRYSISKGGIKGLILVGAVGIEEVLGELRVLNGTPILLIWGSDDSISPLESAKEMTRRLSSARLEIVGKQHACYLDDPQKFNDLVVEFMKSLRS